MIVPENLSGRERMAASLATLFSLSLWAGPVLLGEDVVMFALGKFFVYFVWGSGFWFAVIAYLVVHHRWWTILLTAIPLIYPWYILGAILLACAHGNCL